MGHGSNSRSPRNPREQYLHRASSPSHWSSSFLWSCKDKKAVDEATNLAVRVAKGVTSALLSSSLNASNGMINSAGAAALDLVDLNRGSLPPSGYCRWCQYPVSSRRPTASLQRALGLSSERAGQLGPLTALRCPNQGRDCNPLAAFPN